MIVIVSWADGTTPPVNLARVVVVGTSCSGKTTFAHQLASKLNMECVELDALYWGPGWTPRPTFEGDVLAAVQQARWVIDGNYSRVRDIIWRHATAIAWLDYSFARVFSQAVRRTLRRVVLGERLYGGNRETIRETLFDVEAPLWLVVRTHGRRRREFPELFERAEYRHVGIILWRAHAQHPCAGLDNLANLFNDAGEHLSSSPHDAGATPQALTVASSASPSNAIYLEPRNTVNVASGAV